MFGRPEIKLYSKTLSLAAIVFCLISCGNEFNYPETGCYYDVKVDGNQYFVRLDSCDGKSSEGHYYTVTDDTLAVRHDFTSSLARRRLVVTVDGTGTKLKPGSVSYSIYEEPPFGTGNLDLYRKACRKVSVVPDVCYGKAKGYWSSLAGVEQDVSKLFSKGVVKSFKLRDLDLSLDLYRPEEVSGKSPLIMFIHGGAFYIGYKDEPAYVDFCRYFTSMGYVTASINYRLGFHLSKNEIERAGYAALQDAHAALRYLVAHADEYGIDTDRIFVAGSSAGSITALNLAFLEDDGRPASTHGKKSFLSHKADMGDIDSSGNDYTAEFKIKAVANMWGAVNDLDMLGSAQTSIVSFHGEDDTTVPYAEGYPLSVAGDGVAKMLSGEMFGSYCIDEKAGELGLRHHLYSFPGEGHALNTGKDKQPNENHTFIKERMAEFFYEEMVPEPASIKWMGPGCYSVTGHGISDVQWKVEGGFILPSTGDGTIRVLWCGDKPHSLTASGTYGSDIAWIASL